MKRSMYSLILIDKIVNAVDELAYEKNTSRSNLINQILAEYFSMPTPEKRIDEIFSSLVSEASNYEILKVQRNPQSPTINLRSVIKYKYNPTIKYSVELDLKEDSCFCDIKISSRSQNNLLLEKLEKFFEKWMEIENQFINPKFKFTYKRIENKFNKSMVLNGIYNIDEASNLGALVGKNIVLMDRGMNLFFDEREEELLSLIKNNKYNIEK